MATSKPIVGLDLNVDDNYLAECVKQTVIMGISEALNGKNEIVSQLVKSVLETKVDKNGNISSYGSDNRYTLLDIMTRKAIIEVAKEEFGKIVEESRPRIAKAIRAELEKKETMGDLTAAFLNAIEKELHCSYRMNVDIEFTKDKDW